MRSSQISGRGVGREESLYIGDNLQLVLYGTNLTSGSYQGYQSEAGATAKDWRLA